MIWTAARRAWLRRAFRVIRWTRFAGYVFLAMSGTASIWYPPASIADAVQTRLVAVLWSALIVVSAAVCAYGAAANHWVGEYVGLVPLACVALAFGLAAMGRGHVGWAGGAFLVAFFWVLVSRWQEVALLRIEALKATRETGHGDHV